MKSQLDHAPRSYDLAAMLLAQLNPLMAPFNFVLKIVEVVFSLFKAVKSAGNPYKLAKQIIKTAKLMALLTLFAPNIAWVRLVRDMIDLCVAILNGFVAIIAAWVRDIQAMRNAFVVRESLPEDFEIVSMIRCTKGLFTVNIDGVNDTLAAFATALFLIGQLMEILSTFLPGKIVENFVNAIKTIVTLPVAFTGLGAAVEAADNAVDLDAILVQMTDLSLTISNAAGGLATISQAITDVIGDD